ncbi:MAG: HNH endonuclease [Acidobacteriota bacterium]|nr:MAG: HNH endonuclease [Acidobacteriota bacterium]
MTEKDSRFGSLWERDELILALYLYCQVPFAQTKANNPEIIRLAQLLGRTPSSVARKLGNFGAFDSLLAQKGISGLTHYSKADKEIWDEFYERWNELVEESRRLLALRNAEKMSFVVEEIPVISQLIGPTAEQQVVMVRLQQSFFRRAVLACYQKGCCVCDIDLPELLVASHIVPWAARHETRTDPQNGLCLCALHDKAFDRGLISINGDFEIFVSSILKASRSRHIAITLLSFHKQSIHLPSRFSPNPEYLQWHFDNIFQG